MSTDFELIWARIKRHEGEEFTQIRGATFRSAVEGSAIRPDRTNQLIPGKHIKEAADLLPLDNTVEIQHLRGPSYIYAILMDSRVSRANWTR